MCCELVERAWAKSRYPKLLEALVQVQTGATISVGRPTRLFQSHETIGLTVTRDGSRFIVCVRTTDALSTITVIPNWAPERSK